MTATEIADRIANMQRKRIGTCLPRFTVRAVDGGWTYGAAGGIVFADKTSAETDARFAREWEGL